MHDAPPTRLADLTDLACPPYDVIDEAMRRELLARDPHNAVRLELNPEPDPHAAAATTLAEWVSDGILARREEPAVYYYRHATAADPDTPTVEGIVARVLLEPWGDGVRPHEHTMPGPKADRLALLHATRHAAQPDPERLLRPLRALPPRHEPRLERRVAGARRGRAAPPGRRHRGG